MDKYGSYLVEEDEYKYSISELDGEEKLYMTAWSTLDLYMCERGYIDDDGNRDIFSRAVDRMSFFLEFEYLTTDYLQKSGVAVKDEITGEAPSSGQTLIEDNLFEENSNEEMENTYGVKADSYYEESPYWTKEEILDMKEDAENIILSQEIINLEFTNYEQPEDMIDIVHKITGIAKNNSNETISYYNMVFQTNDGATWSLSSSVNTEINPGEQYEITGLIKLPGVYLTDDNKDTSVPICSQVILYNSKRTNIGYDFKNGNISLFGRSLESYIGQPK